MKRLAAAGYRVTPHWKIGTFRIDLVVEGEGKRLAIECDGDRYQPLEKLSEDMDRQCVLERMGWIFTRIRSSEFLRNPARAMKPIFEKLEALEIPSAGKTRESKKVGPHMRLSFAKTLEGHKSRPVTMLQTRPHAIHFKRILDFGEGQGGSRTSSS